MNALRSMLFSRAGPVLMFLFAGFGWRNQSASALQRRRFVSIKAFGRRTSASPPAWKSPWSSFARRRRSAHRGDEIGFAHGFGRAGRTTGFAVA